MGNNQYYLDDDWYQDIKLDASIPISSGEDLISSSSFHTANSNKDKSLTSSQHQNNGNIISNPKCLHDKNNDSADANLDIFIGDDNDNPASYLPNKSHENEV